MIAIARSKRRQNLCIVARRESQKTRAHTRPINPMFMRFLFRFYFLSFHLRVRSHVCIRCTEIKCAQLIQNQLHLLIKCVHMSMNRRTHLQPELCEWRRKNHNHNHNSNNSAPLKTCSNTVQYRQRRAWKRSTEEKRREKGRGKSRQFLVHTRHQFNGIHIAIACAQSISPILLFVSFFFRPPPLPLAPSTARSLTRARAPQLTYPIDPRLSVAGWLQNDSAVCILLSLTYSQLI